MILFFKIIDFIAWLILVYLGLFKRKKIKFWKLQTAGAVVVLAGVLLLFAGMPNNNFYVCRAYDNYRKMVINQAIVIDKKVIDYRMTGDVAVLNNLRSSEIDTLYLTALRAKCYNSIKPGDTIVKKEYNDSLFKKEGGRLILLEKITCGCDTNQYKKENKVNPFKIIKLKDDDGSYF